MGLAEVLACGWVASVVGMTSLKMLLKKPYITMMRILMLYKIIAWVKIDLLYNKFFKITPMSCLGQRKLTYSALCASLVSGCSESESPLLFSSSRRIAIKDYSSVFE